MSHQLIDGSANNVLVVDDDLVQGSVISNLCSMIGYNATFVKPRRS
jgi:CheY-like chemotaxis protein